MKPSIVDTNVPVVANGTSHVSGACVRECASRLRQIEKSGTVVIDDQWLIVREYQEHLRTVGQPGPGDGFLKFVLTNLANPDRCTLVHVTSVSANGESFREFPADPRLARFDPADRKFIAVARACPQETVVLEAADAEWWAVRDALEDNGVRVEFLCPDDIRASRRAGGSGRRQARRRRGGNA